MGLPLLKLMCIESQYVVFQFGGNPVACAMGMAVLDVIKNEQMLSSAKSVGKCLTDGFKAILVKHPLMGDVRYSKNC